MACERRVVAPFPGRQGLASAGPAGTRGKGQPGSGCKWRCSVRFPKGKNAAECGYKGQRLIEHQMVTGFRHGDDRNVTSTQFADVLDRKRVVEGKGVSVRVDLGGGRIIKK